MPNDAPTEQTANRTLRKPCRVTFFHIVWIFLVASFVGLMAELVVARIMDGHWESRAGFILGPFSPIYGLGAVLGTLTINPLRDKNVLLQFLVGGLVGGFWEYLGGTLLEELGGIVAWSYQGHPGSDLFHGHTCFGMMVVWGVVAVVWTLWVLPAVLRLIELIPEKARFPLTAIAFIYIMVDATLTIAALDSWFCRQAGYPIEGPIQEFCAVYFNDEFMSTRFETMGMWTVLANR